MSDPGRPHNVSGLSASALERVRRELTASLALARPGSLVGVPTMAQLRAIDAELTARTAQPDTQPLQCSCGFATDDPAGLTVTCSSSLAITASGEGSPLLGTAG
jgi:hypothetical protein